MTERLKPCDTPACRRMRALLSDFLDHSMHWRTARSLAAHLAACPSCAVFVASVERTFLLYRERPVVDSHPRCAVTCASCCGSATRSPRRQRTGRCLAGAAIATAPG